MPNPKDKSEGYYREPAERPPLKWPGEDPATPHLISRSAERCLERVVVEIVESGTTREGVKVLLRSFPRFLDLIADEQAGYWATQKASALRRSADLLRKTKGTEK